MSLVGKTSPWGKIDFCEEIGEGAWSVGTPSHGGIKLDRQKNAMVPAYMRKEGGWYEEDCDWSIVATVFPAYFKEAVREHGKISLRNWHPSAFEQFYGEAIAEGTSLKRDEELFDARHKDDFVVISASNSATGSKYELPEGMVLCLATMGGLRTAADHREGVYFLVSGEEYAERKGSFVIDPARHKRPRLKV